MKKFNYTFTLLLFAASSVFAQLDGTKFIPFTAGAPRYEKSLGTLPSGAKDFAVEKPDNANGKVVNANEMGLCDDPENIVKKLNEIIAHCKKIGASKLCVNKGIYLVTERDSIVFDGLKNFVFDGGGATFVFRKGTTEASSEKGAAEFLGGDKANNMEIRNCERVEFANFNFDWDWDKDPLASIVKVSSVHIDAENSWVDFTFVDYKDFPNKKSRMINISAWDAKNKCVGREDGFSVYMDRQSGESIAPKKEWISPNTVRIHYDPSIRFADWRVFNKLKVGSLWRMQHYYYHMGAINMGKNSHLTMRDINIYSAAGHGIHVGGLQKYWQMENVNIKLPDYGKNRPITVSADHMHIGASQGFFKMKNCEFGLGADDCINMHDCTGFAVREGKKTILTKNAGVVSRYFHVGDPVELRNSDYSPTGFTAKIKSIKPVNASKGEFIIEFFQDIPEQKLKGFVMFNWLYNTHNIIIDNCFFYGNRARGLLVLASDVTIQNCRFYHHEFGAIKLETGYTFDRWSEGYGVRNVVIRNNKFEHVDSNMHINTEGISATEINFQPQDAPTFVNRDIYIAAYLENDPSTIASTYPVIDGVLFEGNTFTDTFGFIANMSSCGNIVFKDNTFVNKTRRLCNLGYRGCFNVRYADGVKIVNNTIIQSPLVKAGVYYEPSTTKNLLVEGNTIKDEN